MINLQCRIFTSEIDIIEWDWNKFQPHLFINNCYNSCTSVSIWVSPFPKKFKVSNTRAFSLTPWVSATFGWFLPYFPVFPPLLPVLQPFIFHFCPLAGQLGRKAWYSSLAEHMAPPWQEEILAGRDWILAGWSCWPPLKNDPDTPMRTSKVKLSKAQ